MKEFSRFGIVAADGSPAGTADENDRNRMKARIPLRIGVDTEQIFQFDIESRLFLHLPDTRMLDTLSNLDKSTGQGEAVRTVFSFDQNNPLKIAVSVETFDNTVGGEIRSFDGQCVSLMLLWFELLILP